MGPPNRVSKGGAMLSMIRRSWTSAAAALLATLAAACAASSAPPDPEPPGTAAAGEDDDFLLMIDAGRYAVMVERATEGAIEGPPARTLPDPSDLETATRSLHRAV